MKGILKLRAVCKDYIWGGEKLGKEYGKSSEGAVIAESWELSCHKDGESIVENTEYAGFTLKSYIEKAGKSALGTNAERFSDFPLLIKLIDARDNLSLQVHPDDKFALANENEYGKTEMWYILDCEEGAELIYGVKKKLTREEFRERIMNNTVFEAVNRVKVKKGDVFFIEAGTLHGIGKGIVIAEIQQNSNTTYRVYDYGRVGTDGKPRPLHIEKALEVTSLVPCKRKSAERARKIPGGRKTLLASHEYFNVNLLELSGSAVLKADETSFNSVLVIDGEGELDGIKAKKGDSFFIPAGYGEYGWSGAGKLILTDIV